MSVPLRNQNSTYTFQKKEQELSLRIKCRRHPRPDLEHVVNETLFYFSTGTNYEWVATHELGHILGLEHDTQNKDAVMYPYYRPYNPNGMKLHENDIKRIQAQYGKNTGPGPRTTFSTKQTTKTPSTTKSKTTKTMSPTTNTCKNLLNFETAFLNTKLFEYDKKPLAFWGIILPILTC